MGSEWDYINEHMGGHDDDGLPNFMSEPYFTDDFSIDAEIEAEVQKLDMHHKIWGIAECKYDEFDYKSMLNLCQELTLTYSIPCKLTLGGYIMKDGLELNIVDGKYIGNFPNERGPGKERYFIHIPPSLINSILSLKSKIHQKTGESESILELIERASPISRKVYKLCYGELPEREQHMTCLPRHLAAKEEKPKKSY